MKKLLFLCLCGLSSWMANAQKPTGYSLIRTMPDKGKADSIKNVLREMDPRPFEALSFRTVCYRLMKPQSLQKHKRYPLVLVLHGSGAVGTDNNSQLGLLAKLWAQPRIRRNYPAFVVAPQFPERSSNYVMDSSRHTLVSEPGPNTNTVLALVDSLKKVLPVDGRRIYVIGFSMGASSVINSIGLRPDLFAAGVAISGVPDFDHLPALEATPLWVVHGNADTENPYRTDSILIRTLQGRQLRAWEIDQLQHEIYSELYTTDLLPEWLFSHTRWFTWQSSMQE
ncbi:alpha/beta fold hydrolase [Chitinophaga sp. G-6-1-13]|uniref:Alpha/beta fold hydrolase n=1 Tax=Chitinophaga fulva TaxID=2728842 RepID=A0A848GHU8_9BACT|nr:alpha/beta hydrolase-fold protein [Chitinophaga fulva]NML37291.1 alpha/beta fold hydrolase [Chitinophaga fulva]